MPAAPIAVSGRVPFARGRVAVIRPVFGDGAANLHDPLAQLVQGFLPATENALGAPQQSEFAGQHSPGKEP